MEEEKNINKALDYLNEFVKNIKDTTKEESQKLSYFASNFGNANKILTALKEGIDSQEIAEDIKAIAEETYNNVISEIQSFRDNISNTSEEHSNKDVVLSEETIKDALDNNSATKQLQEDVTNLVNNSKTQQTPNYGAVIAGSFVQIIANSKEDLAEYISNIIDKNNVSINDVQIFEMKKISFTAKQTTKISIN